MAYQYAGIKITEGMTSERNKVDFDIYFVHLCHSGFSEVSSRPMDQ